MKLPVKEIENLIEPLIKLGEFNFENLSKEDKKTYLVKMLYENMKKKALYIGQLESELAHLENENQQLSKMKDKRRHVKELESQVKDLRTKLEDCRARMRNSSRV